MVRGGMIQFKWGLGAMAEISNLWLEQIETAEADLKSNSGVYKETWI